MQPPHGSQAPPAFAQAAAGQRTGAEQPVAAALQPHAHVEQSKRAGGGHCAGSAALATHWFVDAQSWSPAEHAHVVPDETQLFCKPQYVVPAGQVTVTESGSEYEYDGEVPEGSHANALNVAPLLSGALAAALTATRGKPSVLFDGSRNRIVTPFDGAIDESQ